jgi:hypothetical protein
MEAHPRAIVRRIWYSADHFRNEAVTSRKKEWRYDTDIPMGTSQAMTHLFLAAAVVVGVALAPAVLAKDADKSAISKHKSHRSAKAHKTTRGLSAPVDPMKPGVHPYGEPYTMQKDEMTR